METRKASLAAGMVAWQPGEGSVGKRVKRNIQDQTKFLWVKTQFPGEAKFFEVT